MARSNQERWEHPGTNVIGLASEIDREPRRGRGTAFRTYSGRHDAKGNFNARYDSGWKEI